MSDFEKAVDFVLNHEGGLIENPNDPGGITKYGISLRFLREVDPNRLRRYGIFDCVMDETIRILTLDQAKFIYRGEFWEGNNFDQIHSQNLCSYVFDMAVAHGVNQAIKLIQRGLWAIHYTRDYLRADGILGEQTIGELNALGDRFLAVIVAVRGEFYRHVAAIRNEEHVFLDGWLNRCYSVF